MKLRMGQNTWYVIEAVELDNWHVNVRHALARDARVARDAVRARQLVKTPNGTGRVCIACGVGHRCYKRLLVRMRVGPRKEFRPDASKPHARDRIMSQPVRNL